MSELKLKLTKPQIMMLTMMAGKYRRNTSKSCGCYKDPDEMDYFEQSIHLKGSIEKKLAIKQTYGAVVDFSRADYHEFKKSTVNTLLNMGLIEEHVDTKYSSHYEITEAGKEQIARVVNEEGVWWDVV